MHEHSSLAPSNPTGPGTSLGNPFKVISIMHGYTLLDRLHFRSPAGGCKVRYDRVGSKSHPSFPNPIDHYVLFEGDMSSKDPKGKLMDFYVFGYSDHPHSDDDLPAGLTVIKMDKDFQKQMHDMVEKSPELKRMFEERALLQINMARLQRGLSPLDRLPEKGSCLIAAFALLAAGSGLGWALTHLIA